MQGLVGLGLNLVSAPVVTLVAPSLMPELLLVLAVLLPFFTLARSHAEIDWGGLGWVLSARVPGDGAGRALPGDVLRPAVAIAVALMVLLAVLLSLAPVEVPVRREHPQRGRAALRAGRDRHLDRRPPVALLYQHRSPEQIRSTLAVLFTVGAGMSLVGIWLSGHLDTQALPLALVLTPCLLVGAWIGGRLQPVLAGPARAVRRAGHLCGLRTRCSLVRSLSLDTGFVRVWRHDDDSESNRGPTSR